MQFTMMLTTSYTRRGQICLLTTCWCRSNELGKKWKSPNS